MIGQIKLQNKLNTINLDTLPKSLLLVGEEGCGKHLVVDTIAKNVGIQVVDVSDRLNLETVDEMSLVLEPTIYLIDGNSISQKEEAVLLKILEEPYENNFIIILCEDRNSMLNTIINRCQIWEFETYTDEELNNFTSDNLILNVVRTPGQIEKLSSQPIEDILNFCNKIFDNIWNANFANMLMIPSYINFKEEPDKYDYDVFVKLLEYCAFNRFIDNNLSEKIFRLTHNLLNDSKIKNINKKHLLENYLINLKESGI